MGRVVKVCCGHKFNSLVDYKKHVREKHTKGLDRFIEK